MGVGQKNLNFQGRIINSLNIAQDTFICSDLQFYLGEFYRTHILICTTGIARKMPKLLYNVTGAFLVVNLL